MPSLQSRAYFGSWFDDVLRDFDSFESWVLAQLDHYDTCIIRQQAKYKFLFHQIIQQNALRRTHAVPLHHHDRQRLVEMFEMRAFYECFPPYRDR